jgi:hypothetical protein
LQPGSVGRFYEVSLTIEKMDLDTFRRLLTPEGGSALAAATDLHPTEATVLNCLDRLRKHFDPHLARAAVETVLLRDKAKGKFVCAESMFFTREALEQASGRVISSYRADRFDSYTRVVDLCCGIGSDAIELGRTDRDLLAVESDPVRAALAEYNLYVYGIDAEVRVTDVLTTDLSTVDAAYCDPSRRAEGKRFLAVADYLPPPAAMIARFPSGFPLAFKLAPGVLVADAIGLGGEVEFLSVGGELKECVAWLGPFRSAARRATVLPSGESLAAEALPPPAAVTPIGGYLFDPDPAVVRAGLDDLLAATLGLTRFDHSVAGLTGDSPVSSPFVTAYRVEEVLPFHVKKVGARLKHRGIGRVTPVKRGVDVDTEAVLKVWKLTGGEHRTVIFTRTGGRVVVVVCERMDHDQ